MWLIFLDTETTGLNPQRHRLLEIAYTILDVATGRPILSYESLISQPAEVWGHADPSSSQIHGLSWETTLQGKPEKVVASEIIQDFTHIRLEENAAVFLCQNPAFDKAFFCQIINVDLQERYGWPYHWLDLASMYWALLMKKDPMAAGQLLESALSKNAIAHAHGLPPEKVPHRARQGVDHLIQCYTALFASSNLSSFG